MTGGGIERRSEIRVPFTGLVSINGDIMVKAVDISRRGIYLYTGRSFPSGSIVELNFRVAAHAISVRARVHFNREGVGMGLKFVRLAEDDLDVVLGYIENQATKQAASGLSRKKVLVIDPDDSSTRVYTSILVQGGYTVLFARGIREAVTILETAADITVLVVILDVEKSCNFIPLELLLRNFGKRTATIVISPNTLPTTAGKVLQAGAREFLPKSTTTPKKVFDRVRSF